MRERLLGVIVSSIPSNPKLRANVLLVSSVIFSIVDFSAYLSARRLCTVRCLETESC